MKRRSFFTSLAKAAAIVALAPQLAFRVKPIVWIHTNEGIMHILATMERRQLPSFRDFILSQMSQPYKKDELIEAQLLYGSNQPGPETDPDLQRELEKIFS